MRLAVIPARGGSKRIERKNIRQFCGQPMLAYSIQAAMNCSAIDAVWVSTEDAEIAEVARMFGAEVPFERPQSLADDHTIMQTVMSHALEFAKQEDVAVNEACLIFATAPFLLPADLTRGWERLRKLNADFALSVVQFRTAPQRAQYVDDHGFLRYTEPEQCHVRSQDLQPLYHDAAQFVWGTPESFSETSVVDANIAPVHISSEYVVDIDTSEDWAHAEHLYTLFSNSQLKSNCS